MDDYSDDLKRSREGSQEEDVDAPDAKRVHSAQAPAKKKKGFVLSDDLSALVGTQRATSKEVVNLIGEYVRQHQFQKGDDKNKVWSDEKLKKKYLKPHMFKDEECDETGRPFPNVEQMREDKKKELIDSGKNGFYLSKKMAAFMGCERCYRGDITKKLWVYIKAENLQDPSDKRNILFDTVLQDLFGVSKASMFDLAKFVSNHVSRDKMDE